jgi:hypothetical protein
MKVIVKTLIDITETKRHKHNCDDKQLVNQQANFMSFFNTLSMRFNPYYDVAPIVENVDISELGFGSKYTGKQNVWTFEFTIETAVAGIDLKTLNSDFDLIPVIPNLTETINTNSNRFNTVDDNHRNIVFILPDNE